MLLNLVLIQSPKINNTHRSFLNTKIPTEPMNITHLIVKKPAAAPNSNQLQQAAFCYLVNNFVINKSRLITC